MHLSKFINTKTGRLLMSIVLGLGLSCLFRESCKGKHCIVQLAPPDVTGKTFKYNDKCYSFVKTPASRCKAKTIASFA